MPDAAAALASITAAGVPVVQELREEPFGQRHFYRTDSSGTLVNVIEKI
ncbi:hypothetical protein GCM10010174_84880 [Kutzneria viridogrisea]|uniref:VOC domain-containing protein n=2 Tax=Kutzneria TaxID=43356 RepID=W5VZP0_9PSEU|nr:hypothetical protein [Kutzneria albida]AHH94042.1 hypothetical protein KALB_667 [Kutzneria albida DSM 43870]MBA8930952.1 putative enzyme related to lactoylglutathione lyase [Kutzneria viridogrisea]